MKGIIYLISVVLITAAIITGLYYYEKGQTKDLSSIGNLDLGSGVELSFDRVLVKPAESARYYLIFSVKAKNTTSNLVNLRPESPADPCSRYGTYNSYTPRVYGYSPAPASTPTMTIQQCQQSDDYKKYLTKKQEYENWLQKPNKIDVQTADGEICTINYDYKINNSKPNIGRRIFDSYQATETKAGSLVFDCAANKGKFSIKYLTQVLNFEI